MPGFLTGAPHLGLLLINLSDFIGAEVRVQRQAWGVVLSPLLPQQG